MSTSIAPVSHRRQLGHLLRAVVKVICVSDAPDYDQPWQTQGSINSVGSGVIVETSRGLRVLTNAHCVANHVFVELRRYGKAQKVVATVEAIGHECDLALLEVEDEEFFGNTAPIAIGELPRLGDRVSVCGYPIGGERLSITEGIVSRIDLVCYAQSNRELLAVQIDAAINAGNSGGPVLKDGRLVGVAFQALDEGEQIGYMIAPPVVEHFLKDLEDGNADGFPALGVTTQQLESMAHRRQLGLAEDQPGGVLVKRVAHGGSADGVLEPGDVLLAVDGVPVSADGTVELRPSELVHYRYFVSKRHVGERVPMTVWRQRQEVTCVLDLRPPAYLVAEERYDVRPSYYIAGGLLFVPLTRDFLKTWGDQWWQSAPRDLVALYESGVTTSERTEPVVLQKVLAHRVNQGYHDLDSLLVDACYGVPVRSLAHLIELIETRVDEPYLELQTSDGTMVVLDRADALGRDKGILRKYGVRHDRSEDLRGDED
ncbi:MAG: trypsin-like peptidase domain-containing protein [Deltaproteobacteria bacterium]|nr:trypsin-like peptidase domain-containing protein [Deltaproteobacteria bacterium]